MADFLEHDFDNPVHRQRRRRLSPILEGEILEPQSEPERRIRVTIATERRRHNTLPQQVVIFVAFFVLALIAFRSPGALILLAVLIPNTIWIALGVVVGALVLISIRERLAGRDF